MKLFKPARRGTSRMLTSIGLLLALLLAGCQSRSPAQLSANVPEAQAAQAGSGRFGSHSWLVTDTAAIVAALPALPDPLPESAEPPADITVLDTWAEPASAWMSEELHAIVADSTNPIRAARSLMLLSVAMNDGLVAGDRAREQGAEVSDDALLAEVATRVLAYTHPTRVSPVAAAAETATWVGVWNGEATVTGVLNGRQLGAAVADEVIAWGMQDGSLQLNPSIPLPTAGLGVWEPTGPAFDRPETPEWGKVKTVAIGDPASVRAPAPPSWESDEMRATYAAFVETQRALTDEDRALATKWAAGMGTVTPPGVWVKIAQDLVAEHGLSSREAAGVYAALSVALHDSAVACWETKYTYWLARPQQAMEATDTGWRPFLITPPHPSYPSGHATFSGAASTVLSAAFPDAAAWLTLQAKEAARSRVLGGIHWPIDGEAGLEQGQAVAERVLMEASR